jgi:hypothetical protein
MCFVSQMEASHGCPMSTTTEFRKLLKKTTGHDLDPSNVTIANIQRWHRTQEEQRAASFARGYMIGRALKYQRDRLKHGVKGKWAKKVGISSQSINGYIRGFEAIEKAEKAGGFDIPVDVSFSGWTRSRGSSSSGRTNPVDEARKALRAFAKKLDAVNDGADLEAHAVLDQAP